MKNLQLKIKQLQAELLMPKYLFWYQLKQNNEPIEYLIPRQNHQYNPFVVFDLVDQFQVSPNQVIHRYQNMVKTVFTDREMNHFKAMENQPITNEMAYGSLWLTQFNHIMDQIVIDPDQIAHQPIDLIKMFQTIDWQVKAVKMTEFTHQIDYQNHILYLNADLDAIGKQTLLGNTMAKIYLKTLQQRKQAHHDLSD